MAKKESVKKPPTDGSKLQPAAPNDYTTYWTKVVPYYGLAQEQARELLREAHNDAQAAYRRLMQGQ